LYLRGSVAQYRPPTFVVQFKIINSSYVTLSDSEHSTVQFKTGKVKKKKEEEKGGKSRRRII
jgi:hypothetical protein